MTTETLRAKGPLIWVNTLFIGGSPFLAALLVPTYLWFYGSHPALWVTALALWIFAGLGITVGYHRLIAHRSFDAHPALKVLFLVAGASAIQNSAITWSVSHRRHHLKTDSEADPYNAKRGFWWSHMGWIFYFDEAVNNHEAVPDLAADKWVMWQHKYYNLIWMTVNVVVPGLLGLMIDRVFGMILIAGLLRVVLVHQGTFCINSLCHIVGTQPWSTKDTSRDSWIAALVTFGEGYHNYHHSFPADYRNGLKWYHFDPGKWTIWAAERLRLASNLKRTLEPVRMRRRLERQAESYFAQIERLEAGEKAGWRARLEEALTVAHEQLSAWTMRARRAKTAKGRGEVSIERIAGLKEARRAFRSSLKDFQRLGRSVRMAA